MLTMTCSTCWMISPRSRLEVMYTDMRRAGCKLTPTRPVEASLRSAESLLGEAARTGKAPRQHVVAGSSQISTWKKRNKRQTSLSVIKHQVLFPNYRLVNQHSYGKWQHWVSFAITHGDFPQLCESLQGSSRVFPSCHRTQPAISPPAVSTADCTWYFAFLNGFKASSTSQ